MYRARPVGYIKLVGLGSKVKGSVGGTGKAGDVSAVATSLE